MVTDLNTKDIFHSFLLQNRSPSLHWMSSEHYQEQHNATSMSSLSQTVTLNLRGIPRCQKYCQRTKQTPFSNTGSSFSISSYQLTDGTQFVSMAFSYECGYVAVKHLLTTMHHPQTYCQAKRYNWTGITRLHHYVVEQTTHLGLTCPAAQFRL